MVRAIAGARPERLSLESLRNRPAWNFGRLISVVLFLVGQASLAGPPLDPSCIRRELSETSLERRADFDDLKQVYAERIKLENRQQVATEKSLNLGARFEKRDPHAMELIELGWTLHRNERGLPYLAPPGLEMLVQRYNSKVAQAIQAGKLTEEDTIRLAVIYRRRGVPDDDRNFRVIRLGMDPLPPAKDWKLVTGSTELLSAEEWAHSMSEGKMPFQFGMIDHEGAHISELTADPALMKSYRNFYRRQVKEKWNIEKHGTLYSDPPRAQTPLLDHLAFWRPRPPQPSAPVILYDRVFTLAEWLSVPNIAKAEQINSLLPHFASEQVSSLKQNLRHLEKLDEKSLATHVDRLIDAGDSILLRQGGGLRDPYNLQRYGWRDAENWLESELTTRRNFIDHTLGSAHNHQGGAVESLQSMLHQIEKLKSINANPAEISRLATKGWQEEKLIRQRLRKLLIDRVARYETALFNATKYKITPTKILDEAGQAAVNPASDTYKYFKSFTPKTSFLYSIFVSRAR